MAKKKRVNGKTPNGGDYSEIFFFDKNMELVDEEKASRCIIKEYKATGELINQTYGFVS